MIAKMVFEDGFFHADPHPGNIIMIGPEDAPVIGLIDLGLVGRLSEDLRDGAIRLLIAAATGDDAALAASPFQIWYNTWQPIVAQWDTQLAVLEDQYGHIGMVQDIA